MNHHQHVTKLCASLALLASACAANAQSTVTIYGIADASVRYVDGLSASNAAAVGSATAVSSGVNNTSRFGFRGSEDLGGGMAAIFNLESGINIDTGAQTNATKFFDRASYMGLKASWGTVTMGRQTTVLADALSPVDPLGVRFAGFNPNVGIAALSSHGLGIEYGSAGDTKGSYRQDNSVKYAGKFSDLTVRAMRAFGEQSGNSSALSSSGLGFTYQTDKVAATLGYAEFESTTGLQLKAYVGGISGKLGNNKLSLTYGSNEAEVSSTSKTSYTTLGLGGTMPLTASMDLILAHYRVNRARTAKADDGYNRTVAFLEYKLSKRTKLYAELDRTNWKTGFVAAALPQSATGASLGVVHNF
ncbi:MAG: porin [Rhodoferax sp.]|uniref:porin n=1 Tax=Rhodoferax sp. TaxID=50421 RepID=UPI002625F38D|nr:porin [Rhodoferax sp.]MDD2881074.1 porin [Rhodoferax sp.]